MPNSEVLAAERPKEGLELASIRNKRKTTAGKCWTKTSNRIPLWCGNLMADCQISFNAITCRRRHGTDCKDPRRTRHQGGWGRLRARTGLCKPSIELLLDKRTQSTSAPKFDLKRIGRINNRISFFFQPTYPIIPGLVNKASVTRHVTSSLKWRL